jgi:hypothetical protein
VSERPVRAGSAGSPEDASGVGIGLALLETCDGSTVPLVAHAGTATFYELGVAGDARVRAHFSFDLFDDRSGERVGWGFEADVDFDVSLGTPTQQFVDPSSQAFH